MTSKQIKKILNSIGYEFNKEIPLSELKYVYLTTDGCLFPGDDVRFKFIEIGESGLMQVIHGTTDQYGVFTQNKNKSTSIIDFSVISGFVMNPEYSPRNNVKIGDITYLTINDALNAAVTGDEIKLTNNLYLNTPLKVTKNVVINLNGYTLATPKMDGSSYAITISNNTALKNGKVKLESVKGIGLAKNKNLEIDNCEISASSSNEVLISSYGNLAINSGKFINKQDIIYSYAGSVSISGGYFTSNGENIIAAESSTVQVSGGNFSSNLPENMIAPEYSISESGGRYIVTKLSKYTVKFVTNNETTLSDLTVVSGTSLAEPSIGSKEGYTFGGWYTNSGFTTPWNFETDTVARDLTLYAKWILITYTVTYENNGYGSKPSSLTGVTNLPSTLPNLTETGYTFGGWYTDSSLKNKAVAGAKLSANVTLYAKWTIKTYTVTFNNDGSTSTASVTHGNKVSKPSDPSKTGYTFAGWKLNGKTYDFSTPVTKDITLVATWAINTYTVTFDVDGITTTQTVEYNTTVSKPADPKKDGYTFKNWTLNGSAYNFSTPVTSDITLKANFTVTQHIVYGDTRDGLTVIAIVNHGDATGPLPEFGIVGHEQEGWLLNGEPYDESAPVTGTLTLTPNYIPHVYTVSFYSDDTLLSTVEVEYGKTIPSGSVPSDPLKEGATFSGWSVDITAPITSDTIIEAIWAITM